ncbi:hypothetical protein HFP72_32185 [Nocardiopsis sp. ARC36]
MRKTLVSLVTATTFLGALVAISPASAAAQAAGPNRVQVSAACYTANTDLYCDNRAPSNLYQHRRTTSAVVDVLETSFSWFQCWGRGDSHAGGNNVWYWTQGDRNGRFGNIPAVNVFTTVDPPAGINQC